jgi:YidC/Oxa1 family membrane protein insertase
VDRRVLLWIAASTAFILLYTSMRQAFGPPPAIDDRAAQVEQQAIEGRADAETAAERSPLPPLTVGQKRLLTLGSMDPADGFHLLVIFNERGGSIERIELTERDARGRMRYRRTDTRSGYLGFLGLRRDESLNGGRIRVIGPGTPAATAKSNSGSGDGLKVGDVLVAVGDRAVSSDAELDDALEATRPGQRVRLEVLRGDSSRTDAERSASSTQRLVFEAELTSHPLDIVRMTSRGGVDEIPGNLDQLHFLFGLSQLGKRSVPVGRRELPGVPSQHDAIWTSAPINGSDGQQTGWEFRLPLPAAESADAVDGPIELVRRYQLPRAEGDLGYTLDLDLAVRNLADKPQTLAYRLYGPAGITLESWWYATKISPNYTGGAGARDVSYASATGRHQLLSPYSLLSLARSRPASPDEILFVPTDPVDRRRLRYLGIDGQYFTVQMVPQDGETLLSPFAQGAGVLVANPELIQRHKERAANVSCYVDSEPAEVPPKGELKQSLRVFAGPKRPAALAPLGLEDTIEFGWFGWVARPLSSILHLLHFTGNYAIAIVLLTVLVRGLMFPLSRKAAINAQKMQEIAPELKKIGEKYKDDPMKRLQAQQELQKRTGFNPLSGCLPIFIQLPIFIGLYRALSVDIELRQAPLAEWLPWCRDLSAPDMLANWSQYLPDFIAGRGTGWLGPYFNILPVIVVGLFLLQQKLFMPPAMDEQQEMTQKMMNVMTVVMGLFFFRVPAGLCIYFITSSLWSIAERKLVKKTLPASTGLSAASSGGSEAIVKQPVDKGPGLIERIVTGEQKKPQPLDPEARRNRPRPELRKKN